jgi:hypothetical protein
MSLACSTVSCATQDSRRRMPRIFRSTTDHSVHASRNQRWLMTANRLKYVALITGALVRYQQYSKFSGLLKLLKKAIHANGAFISRKFMSLDMVAPDIQVRQGATPWRDYINLVLS